MEALSIYKTERYVTAAKIEKRQRGGRYRGNYRSDSSLGMYTVGF
jgi:hypothetical protein